MRFQMVLTASVDPKGMWVKVSDRLERQRQYLRAFRALLETPDPIIDGITFLENTGADLTPFQELVDRHNPHGKHVELLGLNLNDYPRELGIGYGEFQLLDAGVAASRILTPQHHFVKLTGRLRVKNLTSILHALPPDVDMAADLRVKNGPAIGWCESRLLVFSYDFYQRKIVGMYKEVNGSLNVAAEHCLYQVVRNSPGARVLTRLPREPLWVGQSGSTGQHYDSLSMRMRHPLRVAWRAGCRVVGIPNVRAIWATAPGVAEAPKPVDSPAATANSV